MGPERSLKRTLAAICRPTALPLTLGALLAAGIVAAPGMLPETQAVLVRRTLVDLPAAALALAGGPHREWRAIMGQTL